MTIGNIVIHLIKVLNRYDLRLFLSNTFPKLLEHPSYIVLWKRWDYPSRVLWSLSEHNVDCYVSHIN